MVGAGRDRDRGNKIKTSLASKNLIEINTGFLQTIWEPTSPHGSRLKGSRGGRGVGESILENRGSSERDVVWSDKACDSDLSQEEELGSADGWEVGLGAREANDWG